MSDAYQAALARHGLEDVQPLYRRLLVRLKAQDPAAYEEAVARYRDDVEAASENTLDPWIAYGRWLAARIAPGSLKTIAPNGRARDASEPVPLGELLVHLPDDTKRRGFVVAMPAEPSDAQRETAALLCE